MVDGGHKKIISWYILCKPYGRLNISIFVVFKCHFSNLCITSCIKSCNYSFCLCSGREQASEYDLCIQPRLSPRLESCGWRHCLSKWSLHCTHCCRIQALAKNRLTEYSWRNKSYCFQQAGLLWYLSKLLEIYIKMCLTHW